MADRIMASVAAEWREPARDMLAAAFPDADLHAVGEDVLAISAEGLSIADVAGQVAAQRNPFVRHLFRETGDVDVPPDQALKPTVAAVMDVWSGLPVPLPAAASLQVWASGPVNLAFRPDALRHELETALREQGMRVSRAGMNQVLSVCIAGNRLLPGMNGAANALSDWPGGRVRLARPKGQIARSEFKLEELFRTTELTPPRHGTALDLGASPGGWTRILRSYGLDVVAVDPSGLDPRLCGDARIRHVQTTAAPFLTDSGATFDLIANDMRMDPDMSVGLMVEAAEHLVPGGMMIMTLKLTHRDPVRMIHRSLHRLDDVFELKLVRQLHHNRNEMTVAGVVPA